MLFLLFIFLVHVPNAFECLVNKLMIRCVVTRLGQISIGTWHMINLHLDQYNYGYLRLR